MGILCLIGAPEILLSRTAFFASGFLQLNILKRILSMEMIYSHVRLLSLITSFAVILQAQMLIAGGTPADGTFAGNQIHHILNSGLATENGDYINASGGLNSNHRFYIEVPPGLTGQTMTVQIFDADFVGSTEAADTTPGLDRRDEDSNNPTTTFSLFTPTGGAAPGSPLVVAPGTNAAFNNAWTNLTTVVSPVAGHWEVRVDTSGGENDFNAYGVRASVSGGTELNMYYELGVPGQHSDTDRTRTWRQYPYITQGCSFTLNEFDADSNTTSTNALNVASPSGDFTSNLADADTSANNTWESHGYSGWTADDEASEYGIWNFDLFLDSTVFFGFIQAANYVTLWTGREGASPAPTPGANPPSGSLRTYLPTDAGGAPLKPFIAQWLEHVSGPNPPTTLGGDTRVRVNIQIVNPTPHAITFSSPTNVVTANVPDEGVLTNLRTTYRGVDGVSQGTVSGIASGALDGDIIWNPGVVAGNSTATLRYFVDVDPDIVSLRIPITGDGTTGTYVDETGNTTQGRATYTHGPLCELAITSNSGDTLHVELDSFTAISSGAGFPVQLSWVTASEVDNAGFFIYRAIADNLGIYRKGAALNSVLIPALGSGSSYSFLDPEVLQSNGESRAYYLEDVDLFGKRTMHGPFELSERQVLGVSGWMFYDE